MAKKRKTVLNILHSFNNKLLLGLLFVFALFNLFASNLHAQRGCCSWHGGIDYCDMSVGRYVCMDGTYSPSCGCYKAPKTVVTDDDMREFLDDFDDFEEFVEKSKTPTPIPTPIVTKSSSVRLNDIKTYLLLTGGIFLGGYLIGRKS